MRLIYISEGNIPSKSANSIQAMKMSQALAKQASAFELLTSVSLRAFLQRRHFDFFQWYGISFPFKVVRIPVTGTRPYPFPSQYRHPRFPLYASLYALIRRPSLVYTRCLRAACLSLKLGLKVVLEYHVPAKPSKQLETRLQQMRRGRFLGFVTISEILAAGYVASGLPSEKVIVLPDGVDLTLFRERTSREKVRRALRLTVGQKIAVYCGQMLPDKGIDTILQCARLLPDVSFKLLGGFEELIAVYRRKVTRLNLSNVQFLGFVPNSQIPLYLHAADVLLMPNSARVASARWTSPLKMFEYMASGTPLIATNIPAVREVLSDDNAIFVEPDNAYSLANGIKRAVGDYAAARRIGHQARIDVETHTWDRRASKILAFVGDRINK